MTDTPKPKPATTLRRVFGRGFQEGLRAAAAGETNHQEHPMNAARMQAIEAGQTSIARKVLDAVPSDEFANVATICADLKKERGINLEFNVVHGCLRTLRDSKLIVERAGMYQRVVASVRHQEAAPVANRIDTTTPAPAAANERAPAPPPVSEPLERMGKIADELRAAVQRVAMLASEVESVALDVEDRIKAIKADTAKLDQLKSLLHSIGMGS